MATQNQIEKGKKNLSRTGKPKDLVTDKMRLFVFYKKEGKGNQEAAILAGYKENRAHASANDLLKKPWVIQQLEEWHETLAKKNIVTHERITEELTKWAFTPMSEFFEIKTVKEKNGSERQGMFLKPDAFNSPILSSMVKSMKVHKNGAIEATFKSGESAIEMLAKHVNYFDAHNKSKPQEGVQIYLPSNNRDNETK